MIRLMCNRLKNGIKKLGLALVLAMAVTPALATTLVSHEKKIQTGLIYHFVKTTQWPASILPEKSSLYICLAGQDPFEGHLNFLDGRQANRREIVVRHLKGYEGAEKCHALVISETDVVKRAQLLKDADAKHMLTISTVDGFVKEGGMIELSRKGKALALYINTDALNDAGLKVNKRMLTLADERPVP